MKRRSLLFAVLLIMGGALVAYPIVSPVPDPDGQLRLDVQPASDEENYPPIVEYQQLSTNAQGLFDEALRNRTAIQPTGQAPDRWIVQVNRSQQGIAQNYIVKNERYYGTIFILNNSAGRLRLNVRPPPENRSRPPVVEYQQLSSNAQTLFDEAIENGTATQSIRQAPDRWRTQTNSSRPGIQQQNYIIRNETYYPTFPTRETPSPSLSAIVPRVGSLGIGICLILYVGYRTIVD